MRRAVEKYYTVQEAAWLLGYSRDKTVIQKLKEGAFGSGVRNLGTDERPDYRIPASGINDYLDRHPVFRESEDLGLAARTPGELKRKAGS